MKTVINWARDIHNEIKAKGKAALFEFYFLKIIAPSMIAIITLLWYNRDNLIEIKKTYFSTSVNKNDLNQYFPPKNGELTKSEQTKTEDKKIFEKTAPISELTVKKPDLLPNIAFNEWDGFVCNDRFETTYVYNQPNLALNDVQGSLLLGKEVIVSDIIINTSGKIDWFKIRYASIDNKTQLYGFIQALHVSKICNNKELQQKYNRNVAFWNDKPNSIISWKIRNRTVERLDFKFYSQNRFIIYTNNLFSYKVEPDFTQEVTIENCKVGEKICYGAVSSKSKKSYGKGDDFYSSCDDCCAMCGEESYTIIKD